MDQSKIVNEGKCEERLGHEALEFFGLFEDGIGQRNAVDVFEREETRTVDQFAEAIDLGNVGVGQGR